MIEVSKLTDDFYPHFLLGFDKLAIKEINQDITFSRVKSILSQLDDGTPGWGRSCLFFVNRFGHN